ncbi:MAG: hypothetical protein IPH10_14415 [bacterium]|nr:hypothetical protein [bacterium]
MGAIAVRLAGRSYCFALSYSEASEFYDILCQSVFNMTFVQVMNDPQLSDLSPLYPLLNHGITDGFGPQHCKRLMQEMRELRKAVFNSDPIQALADDELLWFFNMYHRYLKAFEFGSDDGTVSICG